MPQRLVPTLTVRGPWRAARDRTAAGRRGLRALALGAAATLGLLVLPGAAGAATLGFPNVPVAADRTDGVGWSTLVVGSTVYVGGTFTTVRSPSGAVVGTRANLAAFDATTGRLRTGFRADTNDQVTDLASDGTNLYAVGRFTTVNGVSRGRIAALDPTTGAVRTSWTANATGLVNSAAVGGSRLYVGGSFGSVGGVARPRVAALRRTDGSVDSGFNAQVDATVIAVGAQPDGSRVYLGGGFTTVDGASRPWLASVDGATGALAGPAFTGQSGPTLDIDVPPGGTRLAVATGGSGNQGAWFSLSTGSKQWRQRCDGDGQAVKVIDTLLYSGFHEACDGDTTVRLTANSTATGVRSSTFRPTFDRFWGVRDLEGTTSVLAVAGDFTRVGGVPAQGFALFRSSG